jgi:uncharacterized membrane protein
MAYCYWKFFFYAYFTAYDLGEKDDPQINAFYFVTLIYGVLLASLVNVLHFFFVDSLSIYKELYFFSFMLPLLVNLTLILFLDGGYKKRKRAFSYLSLTTNLRRRIKILIITCVSTLILFAFTGAINNPKLRDLLSM